MVCLSKYHESLIQKLTLNTILKVYSISRVFKKNHQIQKQWNCRKDQAINLVKTTPNSFNIQYKMYILKLVLEW